MRLCALFGLTILLGNLVACATGGDFQGSGGNGEGASGGSGGEGGGATTTTTGAGTTTDTGTTTNTGTTSSSTTTTTSTPTCEESPCKLVSPQCGCANGDMCSINLSGQRVCHSPGDKAVGDLCVGLYSCVPGALCVQASTSTSVCSPYCNDDAQCGGAAVCILQLNDPQNPDEVLPDVKICSDDCNPITNLGCPSGASLGCQLYNDQASGTTFTLCSGAGSGGQGATCASTEDCAPGHSCFTLGDGSTQCLQFCNVNNPSCATCVQTNPPLAYNGVTYGACL